MIELSLQALWQDFETAEKAQKVLLFANPDSRAFHILPSDKNTLITDIGLQVVKLKHFHKFDNTADALASACALVDSKLSKGRVTRPIAG